MSFVNVILPDGTTFETPVITQETTTQGITTVEHETVHQTDELEVSNVFDAVHDEKFDEADQYTADPNARSKQNLDAMPRLINGSYFQKLPHENDEDNTTDSSSISMYRTIYIEPPPNKPAGFPPPTLFTSGTICTTGEGCFAYIPYDDSGNQVANTKYTFGRAEELGDRSHDNDGMMMQFQERFMTEGIFLNEIHKVHMSPNPTDPALLVYSDRRRLESDYIRLYDISPVESAIIDRPAVFRVDHKGTIHNLQLANMNDRINRLEDAISTIVDSINLLKDHVDEVARIGNINIANIPFAEWNLNDVNI